MFRYSLEHKEFISTNIHGRYVLELTSMFNEKFDVEIQPSQMRAFIKNNGLKSGIDARIKPGSVPPNKGKKKFGSVARILNSRRVISRTIMFL
jgi:hypothetical protein